MGIIVIIGFIDFSKPAVRYYHYFKAMKIICVKDISLTQGHDSIMLYNYDDCNDSSLKLAPRTSSSSKLAILF